MLKISIIIPTLNHLESCLKPCINSLIKSTTFIREDRIVEVLVVANGCTDDTEEYVKSLPSNFSVISYPTALGYTIAINEGLKHCKDSDYFVLLNNDAQILDWGKDIWVDMMLEPFFKDEKCLISGSVPHYSQEANVEFLIFCTVMISKKAIQELGYLDEIFTPGGCEDIDYCAKAVQKGFKWYGVPLNDVPYWHNRYCINQFPSSHIGEQTVFEIPMWNDIFNRNCDIVRQRYNDPNRKLSTDKISIIIPTYNHLEDCLKPCLESLKRNTTLNENVEVIVVANGCTDNTKDYVLSLGKFFKLLFYDAALGYPKAINEALQVAKGDYIILLNNDTTFLDWGGKDTWIKMLLEPFIINEKCALSGPIKLFHQEIHYDFLVFFCVMMSRKTFDTLGYLDEDFTIGAGEDTDYCVRAIQKGLEVVQVPLVNNLLNDGQQILGLMPIYHEAEVTVDGISGYHSVLERNASILRRKYCISKVKVNLTSIDFHDDYANIDLDTCMNMKQIPYSDNSIDELRVLHIIEHFSFHESNNFLKDCNRVLRTEGILVLQTIDFFKLCKMFADCENNERNLLYDHFFNTSWINFKLLHKFLFTQSQLTTQLVWAGFKQIKKIDNISSITSQHPRIQDVILTVQAYK